MHSSRPFTFPNPAFFKAMHPSGSFVVPYHAFSRGYHICTGYPMYAIEGLPYVHGLPSTCCRGATIIAWATLYLLSRGLPYLHGLPYVCYKPSIIYINRSSFTQLAQSSGVVAGRTVSYINRSSFIVNSSHHVAYLRAALPHI